MKNRITEMTRNTAWQLLTQGNRSSGEAADAYRWNSEAMRSPLYAELFRKGEKIGSGRIRGFGPHGIRVETRIEAHKDEYLLVQFTLRENGQDIHYNLFGHVVSCRFNELGLLMDVLVPDTRDGLQALLSFSHQTEEQGNYYRSEMARGSFARSVTLPGNVDGAGAKASFKDGVLELSLPKTKTSKRRSIKVE